MYQCFTNGWVIFENDIGEVKERLFFFKKITAQVQCLVNSSASSIENIIRNLQSGSAILLTRENQTQGVLQLLKLVVHFLSSTQNEELKESLEMILQNLIVRNIKLCKMACKQKPTSSYLYIKTLDVLITIQSQGIEGLGINNLKGNIIIIRNSIQELRNKAAVLKEEESDKGKSSKMGDMADQMEANLNRVIEYAVVTKGLQALTED